MLILFSIIKKLTFDKFRIWKGSHAVLHDSLFLCIIFAVNDFQTPLITFTFTDGSNMLHIG